MVFHPPQLQASVGCCARLRLHDYIQLHVQTRPHAHPAMRADRHVRSFAADAAVSCVRAAAYARAGDGGNQCPTSYYRIVNEAACERAAAAAGERYYGTISAAYYPSGCVYLQGDAVYLNTHPTGSGSSATL